MVRIEINREPVSWLAPLKSGNRFYNPRSKEKEATRELISAQYDSEPITKNVHLWFLFSFKYPLNVTNKKLKSMELRQIIPTKKDTSNLVKFYEDCLKGIVIKDDRTVASICAEKFYGEKDQIRIIVMPNENFS